MSDLSPVTENKKSDNDDNNDDKSCKKYDIDLYVEPDNGKAILGPEAMKLTDAYNNGDAAATTSAGVCLLRKLKHLNIEPASFLPFACDSAANRWVKSLAK